MADNVNITEGSGKTIAADDISSVWYQWIKLVDGTADSTTTIAVDVGAKANALRVAPANDITDGTYIGDIKFGEGLAAGTNAIGKLAANSGVDIGDVDVLSLPASTNTIEVVGDAAEDAAAAGNPLLAGGRYDTTPRELETGDVGAIAIGLDGGVVPGLHATHWNATITSADATSATQVKAAGAAGVRHYITSVVLSTDTAMNIQIQDDAGTPVVAIEGIYLAANGGMVYPIPAGSAIMMGTDAQDIDVIASAAGNISVTMTGFSI